MESLQDSSLEETHEHLNDVDTLKDHAETQVEKLEDGKTPQSLETLSDDSVEKRLEQALQALKRTERQLEKSQKYCEELRSQIETLSTELHYYRNEAQQRREAETQVKEADFEEADKDKPFPDWGPSSSSNQVEQDSSAVPSSATIAESLKAAAEEEVWKEAGFVYDSTSGLYYDYNSGYYYDAARSLYYDPNTTSYFYYDETEQTYKFHSYAYDNGQSGQASSEASVSVQNNIAQSESSKSSNSMKNQRHKEKVKSKNSGKVHKARRRTKESKHKSKRRRKREDKHTKTTETLEETGKESSTVIVVTDSDDDVDDALKHRSAEASSASDQHKKVETMEVDSSDSLATGESEMESEPESGELTDEVVSSSEGEQIEVEICAGPVAYDSSESEITQSHPPCIRVIVQSSDIVDVGTFFLVTCTGGTIGRDKDPHHVMQIKDINVSKIHAEIKYDYDNHCYTVQDQGSQNGTFLNDLRISETKEKSSAIPVSHGDILKISNTAMLLHIHPGSETCDECEPGQVLAAIRAKQVVFNDHVVLTKEEKRKQVRQQMKAIKKKYGLANSAYVDESSTLKNPDYADRADLRRQYIGSEHHSHQKPDEQPASVHQSISSENKGHRLLSKMGWKEGSGLGKTNAGRTEPVSVDFRVNQKAGLGSPANVGLSLDSVHSAHRAQRLTKTQERFEKLQSQVAASGLSVQAAQQSVSSPHQATRQKNVSGTVQSANPALKKSPYQMQWVQGDTQSPS